MPRRGNVFPAALAVDGLGIDVVADDYGGIQRPEVEVEDMVVHALNRLDDIRPLIRVTESLLEVG